MTLKRIQGGVKKRRADRERGGRTGNARGRGDKSIAQSSEPDVEVSREADTRKL